MIVDGTNLFTELQTPNNIIRHNAAREIVERYLQGDPTIGSIARTLGEAAATCALGEGWNKIELPPSRTEPTEAAIADIAIPQTKPEGGAFGEIPTQHAIFLPREVTRIQRYIQAINRAPRAGQEGTNRIIDAGCGPFPILSIAAAVLHEDAQVTAYEVNTASAKVAELIVEILGLSDRISVVNADLLDKNTDIPPAHIAVSETLGPGLRNEPLAQIMDRLTEAEAEYLIPERADIYAVCAEPGRRNSALRQPGSRIARLDFSKGDIIVTGTFTPEASGILDIYTRVESYTIAMARS